MEEQKFTILGPSGVGKTSLMATMYNSIDKLFKNTSMSVMPSVESKTIINDAVNEMDNALKPNVTFEPVPGGANPLDYVFEIGYGLNPIIKCSFKDFPGGFMTQFPEKFKEIVEPWIKESTAMIIPVDASLIMRMVKNSNLKVDISRIHEITQIENIVSNWAKQRKIQNEKALLIIVPLRCETYLHGKTEEDRLKKCVIDLYQEVIKNLRTNCENSEVYYCPVETYGCVEFQSCRWETDDKGKKIYLPVFAVNKADPKREPKYSEEVFACLLKHFLEHKYGVDLTEGVFQVIMNFIANKMPGFLLFGWLKKRKELIDLLCTKNSNADAFIQDMEKLLDGFKNKKLERLA